MELNIWIYKKANTVLLNTFNLNKKGLRNILGELKITQSNYFNTLWNHIQMSSEDTFNTNNSIVIYVIIIYIKQLI